MVGVALAIGWYLVRNTIRNLDARHIATGFGFLWRNAGIPIGETLIPYDPAVNTYFRALVEGVRDRFRGLELRRVVGDFHRRPPVDASHRARTAELTELLDRMGPVNLDAVREHADAERRHTYYAEQKADQQQLKIKRVAIRAGRPQPTEQERDQSKDLTNQPGLARPEAVRNQAEDNSQNRPAQWRNG